ncbi:hypothetical protein A3E95_02220 [Candidatus Nomurabacteria bacterium RIFCSPHIGHO2_12_FULL_44_22b]|nr:MAG: hypothetical protein A3E95_02220 [Candidatus Nomurabacteria bacterium RIFCSPHIGHO2_12_FULL_44_22b]
MRRLFVVISFLFFLAVGFTVDVSAQGFSPVTGQPIVASQTPRAVPQGADLVKYPIKDHRLSVAEIAKYELHPVVLKADVVVLNFVAKNRAFRLDTLKAGTLALADENGNLVYKEDCGNRIVEVKECPKCSPTQAGPTVTPPPTGGNGLAPGSDLMSFLRRLVPSWMRELLKFLLGLILAALLLLLLVGIARAIRDYWNASVPAPAPPLPPAPVPLVAPIRPVAPPPPPVHPGLGAGQRGVNNDLWFGPFQTVTITDRQQDGFHVNVDGRNVATFLQPVRVENAGERGSWVVVTEHN